MIEDNLRRDEARDRATKVSGVSYEINLDLTAGEDTFRSETIVRFTAPLVGLNTFIDLDARGVREITFNGRSVDTGIYEAPRSRIPLRGLLANNELRVVADCAYQHTGVGLHRFVDPTDGNGYLHTQFEPYDAHRVFACFDQPDVKGTFALNVTAPSDWKVISNNPVQGGDAEGGRWSFAATPLLPTYLVAVVAGPYHSVHAHHGDLPLALYCRESLAQYLDPDDIFTITRQGLEFFESEFGYPYPFDKYDQLFVPEFNFGAMENPGCITFNESMVFRSRMTEAAFEGRANTILHEMAHMWFGDLVTMKWWDDLWLNESFATYMASHALASATRFRNSWVRFASGTKAAAAHQDQLPSTHPISADIVDTDAVRLHFDGITYAKGASVLKQLVAWVGAGAFRDGIRTYFRRYEWSNAELSDFLSNLEATSGRELGPWAEEWLETAGVNTLRTAATVDDGQYSSFAIIQEGMPGHDTLRSHRVAVGLYDLNAGLHDLNASTLERRRRIELDVVGPSTDVPDLVGETVPDLLLLNDDDLTYAKVRLDDRSVTTLHDHLSNLSDPLARNVCWAATWDMVRDAEFATRRYVALVVRHAVDEADDSTLARLLGQAVAATDAYGDPENRSSARGGLASSAWRELELSNPSSDRQLVWARHLFSVTDSAEGLSWAARLLDGDIEVAGLKVDTDLRWHIVAVLAAHGTADAHERIDAELDRDPTDIGNRRAAACRASLPKAEAKAEAWDKLMAGDLHLAVIRAIAGGFAQYGQEDLLRPYVEPYFSSVRRLWDERPREEAVSLLNGLYPSTLVETEVVMATDAALAGESLSGPVQRILREGKDSVERALRARAADKD